jgi:MMP 1-O-methyltransferase
VNLGAGKAGIARASEVSSIERLVRRDERFRSAWTTTASVPGSFAELNAAAMFKLLVELRPSRIVEIGSYLGRSTTFLALTLRALGGSELVAIDPHTGDRQQTEALGASTLPSFELFQAHIAAVGVNDIVKPIVARSSDAALGWDHPIDFLYIDGWHSHEAVLQDGQAWLPHLSSNGIVFFDDYTRYREVHDAVGELNSGGYFRLWGNSFGQAFGGLGPPSPAARQLLDVAHGLMARWLFRVRG